MCLEVTTTINKWERELGTHIDKATISKILKRTHSSAVDTKTAEMHYKCLTRWYATPDKISKYQVGKSAECW